MRLVSFSVQNYRSITTSKRIRLGQVTTLIGPNNEGKSNILHALVSAMDVLRRVERFGRVTPTMLRHMGFGNLRSFDWDRDYPIPLQEKQPAGATDLLLEFQLSDEEVVAFRNEVHSALNGTLPISIRLGRDRVEIAVRKKGPGGAALTKKSSQIAAFLAKRITFEYIPAMRSASTAENVAMEMVGRALGVLEDDPKYREAVETIASIQRPVLDQLAKGVRGTLVQFLPNVRRVRFDVPMEDRYQALRRCEIHVDDGTETPLARKGDGVQSLAALGIMRHASERSAQGRACVIAVEEPESHLHPRAIHALRRVIHDLGQKHQVVISTHSPLFANRRSVESNIVVAGGRAHPAKSLGEVRDILGVQASDNLRQAELVVLVEGASDQVALGALLREGSTTLGRALDSGAMAIEKMEGGSNLGYKVALFKSSVCRVHAVLDDDECGKLAFQRAQREGILAVREVALTAVPGLAEAELEDMYDVEQYRELVLRQYGVDLRGPGFKGKKKWSSRVRAIFRAQNKPWDDSLEADVKVKVAALVADRGLAMLHSMRRRPFDALVTALENRLVEDEE